MLDLQNCIELKSAPGTKNLVAIYFKKIESRSIPHLIENTENDELVWHTKCVNEFSQIRNLASPKRETCFLMLIWSLNYTFQTII